MQCDISFELLCCSFFCFCLIVVLLTIAACLAPYHQIVGVEAYHYGKFVD